MKKIHPWKIGFIFASFVVTFIYPLSSSSQNTSSFNQGGTTSSFGRGLALPEPASVGSSASDLGSQGVNDPIDVGAPGVKKIRIAIPQFREENLASDAGAAGLTNRFVEILDFTSWFDFIPSTAFNSPIAPKSFVALDWASLKAEFVVLGRTESAQDMGRIHLELKLYGVKSQTLLTGKQYRNLTPEQADFALRRFGDELVRALTGVPGPFTSRIAFVGKKASGAMGQIFVADFDGKNPKPITQNNAVNSSPAWSPDGTKLTYTSFATGRPEIYMYNFATKRATVMTNIGNCSGSAWSADNKQIAFSCGTATGDTQLFTMNAFGGAVKSLFSEARIEVEPAYSPNGNDLAYTSSKFGRPMIFVRNLQTAQVTRLTYAGWYNASAAWSPNGKEVAFASYDRDIDRWDLFKIKADGSDLERLTLKQGDNESPSWSPDGRFLMFQSDRGLNGENSIRNAPRLFVMSQDGLGQKALKIPMYSVAQSEWGPRTDNP